MTARLMITRHDDRSSVRNDEFDKERTSPSKEISRSGLYIFVYGMFGAGLYLLTVNRDARDTPVITSPNVNPMAS